MPFPNFIGSHKRLWTRENVLAGLVRAAAEIQGPLPASDDYNLIKSGRLDWPPASRVLEYFGSMARGWIAAGGVSGVSNWHRVSLSNIDWTGDEEESLLEHAGNLPLRQISGNMGRSYGAIRKRLQKKGVTARGNQGFLSAGELARLLNCSYSRVIKFCRSGRITADYNNRLHRWEIDLKSINSTVKDWLLVERRTHKTWPVDKGDYYKRYGLQRTVIGGKVKAIVIIKPN